MDELQRQSYLSSLGIDTYVPRWHLPQAPVSLACARPVSVAQAPAPAQATQVPDTPVTTRSGPAPIASVLETLGSAKPAAAAPQPVAEPAPEAEPAPAFALSLWRPEPGLLIVADRESQSGLPTERLVNNLVSALAPGQGAGSEMVWRWPPGDSGHLPRTEADARIAVQTWLETELAKRAVSQVWLFGPQATRYALAEAADTAPWQRVPLGGELPHAWLLPDLISLLREPLLKRQLWTQLTWPATH